MATRVAQRRSTPAERFEPLKVNARLKMSALWTTLLFAFVYVDLFSFFRADVREEIASGTISGFTIGEGFLLGTTAYVLIPSTMVFATLVLRPGLSRGVSVAVSAVYALTIVAGAIGEWGYYLLGSAVELSALAGIVYYAVTWPRSQPQTR